MENQLQIFNNPDFGDIRAIEVDGEPWLVGKDAATALGYKDTDKALRDHVPDKFKLTRQISGSGQRRNMTLWLHATLIKLNVLYKRGRHHYLKAKYDDKGYRVSETVILAGGKTVVSYFWTQAGRNAIYWLLKKNNIVPLRERQALMAELI